MLLKYLTVRWWRIQHFCDIIEMELISIDDGDVEEYEIANI